MIIIKFIRLGSVLSFQQKKGSVIQFYFYLFSFSVYLKQYRTEKSFFLGGGLGGGGGGGGPRIQS